MKKTIHAALPYLVLAAALLMAILPTALWGMHNLDADQSSELVLAALLNKEGRFVTDSWYYSTELRVVSPVPLYQLGFVLGGGSWHAARVIGLLLSFLLAAGAAVYMARSVGLREESVYAAAIMLLPLSEVHKFLFSLGGFYTMYIAAGCALVGLVLRAGQGGRGRLRALLTVLLGFVCGLSGIRMPMICAAPLIAACLLEGFGALRRQTSLRAAARTEQAKVLALGCAGATAMLAGYLVNAKLLAERMHFADYGGRMLGELDFAGFLTQLRYLMQYFGYKPGVRLMSVRGAVCVMVVCAAAFMGISLIRGMLHRRSLNVRERVLLYTAAAALALGMFINVVTGEGHNEYAVGYYLLGVYLLVLTGFAHIGKMRFDMPALRRVCMLALCSVFFLQAALFVRNHVRTEESGHELAARHLAQEGYEAGFATFWNGNILTELSDGQLEVWVLDSLGGTERTAWLQETDHLDTLPQGRVFVYVGEDDRYGGEPIPFGAEALIWQSPVDGGCAYGYDSAQDVMALLDQ